ncbi:MAG: SBBP repeat-containing protein, partial [Acidimicrobiales bacterium]|nr:SBBP repeat-containing protein [Acidimicrobiales bacterium]
MEAWSSDDRAVAVFGNGGASTNPHGYSVVVDSSGNIYTTGRFGSGGSGNETVDFDPGPGTANLTPNGHYDAFVSKLDSSGDLVWAKSFGGGETDESLSVAVDSSGNVYTTGRFMATVDFDPGAGTEELTSVGTHDVFVSKLDSSGNYVWAKNFGAAAGMFSFNRGEAVAVDSSDNVYITGSFIGTVDFDPGPGTANFTVVDGNDKTFVLKLDSSGNLVWVKRIGSRTVTSIALDSSGNIYTTGDFSGTADFDPGPGTTNLTQNGGGYDAFVSKLNSSGDLVWAKSFGSSGSKTLYSNSVAVDSSGNVYTTGQLWSTADFDPGPGTTNLTSVAGTDVFVSKLDSSGDLVWAANFGGDGMSAERGTSVTVDSSGNAYFTGEFNGPADFDPGVGTTTLTATPNNGSDCPCNREVFVLKLGSSGDLVWAKSFGNYLGEQVESVAVDSSGNVYTTGMSFGTVDFDPGPGTTNLGDDYSNVFVSKLDSSGNLAPAVAATPGTPGFTLSTTSVSVAESGTTATFSVVLDTQPAGNVVIYAFSSDPGEAQVGAPLTFTSSNWATPQNFTITGRDDSIVDGNQQAIFTVKIDDDLSHDSYDNVADQTVT